MPLLQVRDCPAEVYEAIKAEAKKEHRTIAQQTIVLVKNGLEKELSPRERRLQALERSRNRYIPEEASDSDLADICNKNKVQVCF